MKMKVGQGRIGDSTRLNWHFHFWQFLISSTLIVAKALDDQTLPQSDPAKIDWSREMDEYFIQLMLEQVRKGNKIGRTFKNKAWIAMIVQFNTKFGYQHGKVVLKNRYNILRRQYSAVKYLLSQGGFSWDEKQQMLIADDRVWKKVIKVQSAFCQDSSNLNHDKNGNHKVRDCGHTSWEYPPLTKKN